MECPCGSKLEEGKSSYRFSDEKFCFILDNIPAYHCPVCGKVLFGDSVVEKVYKLVGQLRKDTSEIVKGAPSPNLYDY